ncbi:hypothetical protein D5086_029675 [Populus alba]|uniref:Uncharacterized protein n=1 Tax=Populus alba TaxID=43335 RepID=A0ACC4AU88_POPAL
MLVCDVSDSFDCLPQFKVLARESRDKNEKYRYKMEEKNGQIVGEDGEVEKLAMVQTKICLLSKVYSFEACFKLKAQKQRYLSNGSICVLQPRRFHDTCKVKSNWASNTKMDLLCVELSWLWGTGAYEPGQGIGNLWIVHRRASDVENDSLLHPIAQETRRKISHRKFCFRAA